MIKLYKSEIYSQDRYTSLGFIEDHYVFYDVEDHLNTKIEERALKLLIMASNDVKENSRSIYTIWDLLGDVGGLYDMLKLISQAVVSLYSMTVFSDLDSFLHESLFSVQRKTKPSADILKVID